MVEGRSAEALGAFAKALCEHGGDPPQIEAIAMDMSPAYVKGATEHFPQARIVFDKFHLMVLAGQALDGVRRELGRDGGSDFQRRAMELARQRLEPERGASRAT